MDQSKKKPAPAPVIATEAERLQESALEIEAEAGLADQRAILEEMREKDENARDTLANIRVRLEKIKEEQGAEGQE